MFHAQKRIAIETDKTKYGNYWGLPIINQQWSVLTQIFIKFKKLYEYVGKSDNQQKCKATVEAIMVYTTEGLTDNIPMDMGMPGGKNNPSSLKLLCKIFINIGLKNLSADWELLKQNVWQS